MKNSKKEEKPDRGDIIGHYVIGGILFLLACICFYHCFRNIKIEETITIKGPLTEKPIYKVYKRGKYADPYLFITFTNYPDQAFNLIEDAYDAADTKLLMSECQAGDTMYFQTDPAKWAVNHLKHSRVYPENSVPIYALWSQKHQYLTLEKYNSFKREIYLYCMLWALGIASFFAGRGYYLHRKLKAERTGGNG